MTNQAHSGVLTAIKMMLSGIVAFTFSQLVPWPFSFWAVITVAAITRPGLTSTYIKGIARFLGTFVGVILAFLSLLIAKDNMYLLSLCLFLIIFFSSALSFQASFISNCGLIVGITVVIVLAVGVMLPSPNFVIFLRFIDVVIGIASVLVINLALRYFYHTKESVADEMVSEFKACIASLRTSLDKRRALITCLSISVITALTFFLWLYFDYHGGYWVTISCLVIMEDNLQKVREKMTLRFFAHVFACFIGGISVYLIGQQSWLMGIPVALTFFVCGYAMVKDTIFGKAANTLAVAVCIMLLIEPNETLMVQTIIERFINTSAGIAIGFLGIWLIAPRATH